MTCSRPTQTDWYWRIPAVRLAGFSPGARRSRAGALGAAHSVEIAFVFDSLGLGTQTILGLNPPQSLADAMHRAWVSFAISADCLAGPGTTPFAGGQCASIRRRTSWPILWARRSPCGRGSGSSTLSRAGEQTAECRFKSLSSGDRLLVWIKRRASSPLKQRRLVVQA